jgi:hypothetical protein
MGCRRSKAKMTNRRKPGTLALAKSVRKPLPRPSRPFKDKKAADRRSWRRIGSRKASCLIS